MNLIQKSKSDFFFKILYINKFKNLYIFLLTLTTDIKTIKEVLGHVQIDTTEIYTHLYNKQVMDAMLEHPMANFMMADAVGY